MSSKDTHFLDESVLRPHEECKSEKPTERTAASEIGIV
jgi:hypothetical protein